MKILKKILSILTLLFFLLILIVVIQYAWKGKARLVESDSPPEIVAHRGVHSNYHKGVYDPVSGCEARHIFPPTHDYIENTRRSIEAAFNLGATIVEIDIRKTADSNLVVFHDFALECRTNGQGLIADHTVDYLKTLDIGYGYTADGGHTFPFRGKGVGLMPALDEVLTAFPEQKFLLDHKDGDTESTRILMRILRKYSPAQRGQIFYWGPEYTLKMIQKEFPEIKRLFMLRRQVKKHFLPFFLTFGLKKIPEQYKDLVMGVPVQYTKYIWGWPYRFIQAVHASDMKLYLMIDTREDAEKYASLPVDGFVTDYIEIVGKMLTQP